MNGCLMCRVKAVGVGVDVRGVSERKVRKQIERSHWPFKGHILPFGS